MGMTHCKENQGSRDKPKTRLNPSCFKENGDTQSDNRLLYPQEAARKALDQEPFPCCFTSGSAVP